MRNKYPAKCYVCGQPCGPNEGQLTPYSKDKWRVRHDGCSPNLEKSKK